MLTGLLQGYADFRIDRHPPQGQENNPFAPFELGGEIDVGDSLSHATGLGAFDLSIGGIQLHYEPQCQSDQPQQLEVGWGYRRAIGAQSLLGAALFGNLSLGGWLSGYDFTMEYGCKTVKVAFVGHTSSLVCYLPNFKNIDGTRIKIEVSPALLWKAQAWVQDWSQSALEIDFSSAHDPQRMGKKLVVGARLSIPFISRFPLSVGVYVDISNILG